MTLPGPTRWARPGSRAVPWIAAVLATLWCADTALAQSPTMRERIYQRLSKAQVAGRSVAGTIKSNIRARR